MSWWAIVYGQLLISPEKESAWRKLTADPAVWRDWPKDLHVEQVKKTNVGKLLARVKDYAKDAFVHFQREGASQHVVGLLHEDAYRDLGGALAVAFRAADRVHATGDVYLADFQMSDFVWRIRLTSRGSTIGRPRREVVKRVLPDALDRVAREADRVRGHL
jgi:hypothetical protein